MRLVKFFGILMIAFTAAGVSYGQSQPENNIASYAEQRDLSESVRLFPMPASDYLHVKIEHIPVANVKLAMHNILGNEVSIESEVVDEHEVRVRVKDLAAGYYLLAVKDDDTKFRGTYKFLKR